VNAKDKPDVSLDEGHETKPAFKGSFQSRHPLKELDDMAAEICSITRTQLSD